MIFDPNIQFKFKKLIAKYIQFSIYSFCQISVMALTGIVKNDNAFS